MAREQADALTAALLQERGVPERVHYAVGVLLDADDFDAEQTYVRGRLARALAALAGHGTMAGLKVSYQTDQNPELEIKVAPGLALDRLGRLIEVRREQCLRVKKWIEAQAIASEARRADLIQNVATDGAAKILVLDVFLRYAVCAHGKTPAFAAGPFNATDYVVPSRLADAFELSVGLAARDPQTKALLAPANSLAELDTQLAALAAAATQAERDVLRRQWKVDAVLNAWPAGDPTAPTEAPRLPKLREHREVADWDKLLLARVSVPVVQDGAPLAASASFPRVDSARELSVDNHLRPIVFNPMRWAGN
jgi:hypothetical protein